MDMTELCQELKNWFQIAIKVDDWEITGGNLNADGYLLPNQYYRIKGSVFNDGVHIYNSNANNGLTDETFMGGVWAMAVPPAVISLLDDINAWLDKYGDTVNSPFSSESFGGYSYTKATNISNGVEGLSDTSWRSAFASRLNKWRKV